jgi:capsule polysaccharide export protein KpsE/RkpR
VPGDEEPPASEVLTALVASLRRELAEAVAALGQARSELAQARERIAELETRLKQNPRKLLQAAVERGTGQAAAETAVAAEEKRPQARRAGRA